MSRDDQQRSWRTSAKGLFTKLRSNKVQFAPDQVDVVLCKFCRTLQRGKWKEFRHEAGALEIFIKHHKNYNSLCESARKGCKLCDVFKRGLMEYDRANLEEWGESNADVTSGFSLEIDDEEEESDCFSFCRGDSETFSRAYLHFHIRTMDNVSYRNAPRGKIQGSGPDIAVALDWLQVCVKTHSSCRQERTNARPSRLLEITPKGKDEEYNIRLIEVNQSCEDYVALSHCWGGHQPLRTTPTNYQAHLNDVPFSSLPKSFQDAVQVSAHLGINRLWIDSLCIVQDSIEDWERECSRMADIYTNAIITIAACNAPNSSAGFLNDYRRDTRLNIGNGVELRQILHEGVVFEDEDSHLSTRAWTLQERFLSPRVLAFKAERTQWQCNTHFMSDDIREPYRICSLKSLRNDLIDKPSPGSDLYGTWRQLVEIYSRCQLSHGTDKLPALSGLAQEFSTHLVNDTYVAGMWRNDMVKSLSWYRRRKLLTSSEPIPADQHYIAPSWSWASTDGEVVSLAIDGDSMVQMKLVQIISVEVESKGLDPFGQVSAGVLCVNGYVWEGAPGTYNPDEKLSCAFGACDWDFLQDGERIQTQQKDVLILLLGTYGFSIYGLVMEEVRRDSGEPIYRRVGIARDLGHFGDLFRPSFYTDCPKRNLKII